MSITKLQIEYKVSYYANAINENYLQYVKTDETLRERLGSNRLSVYMFM